MGPTDTSADYRMHLEAVAAKQYAPRRIADPAPGFYVSAIDSGRKALAEGPFPTHMEALAAVDAVREAWCSVCPDAFWYAWGTARVRE